MANRNSTSLAKAIAGLQDSSQAEVEVPQWGITGLFVKTMTGAERDWLMAHKMRKTAEGMEPILDGFNTALAALTLVDADGNRVYPDVRKGIEELSERNADAVQVIAEAALKVNGMAAEATAEAVEGFEGTPSE